MKAARYCLKVDFIILPFVFIVIFIHIFILFTLKNFNDFFMSVPDEERKKRSTEREKSGKLWKNVPWIIQRMIHLSLSFCRFHFFSLELIVVVVVVSQINGSALLYVVE